MERIFLAFLEVMYRALAFSALKALSNYSEEEKPTVE
jgi:hypothetical protein